MNLKTERESRGLTQTEVAKCMGMLPGDYCKIESGAERKPTKIQRACFLSVMLHHDKGTIDELLRLLWSEFFT